MTNSRDFRFWRGAQAANPAVTSRLCSALFWWIYPEAGTLRTGAEEESPVTLRAEQGLRTSLVAPEVAESETLHVILEVRDAGTSPLWAYRRARITIQP